MLSTHFRPWGTVDWLLAKLGSQKWTLIGCVSTEDRCNAILSHLNPANGLERAAFLEIVDGPSEFEDECRTRRHFQRDIFTSATPRVGSVSEFKLMDSPVLMERFLDTVVDQNSVNIILDISCLPKRFFFPLIRLISRRENVKNLVVTYSVPENYTRQTLAFDPQDWSFLPLFQREVAPHEASSNRVIVGVGFLPFHLPELVTHEFEGAEVTLILPFPPGPPQYQRNWQFVHEIYGTSWLGNEKRLIRRVDATDTSGCFDHLGSIARDEAEQTILAPFGPKPHSLAMCLFAMKHGCDVYYTQPSYYHPMYSTGMKMLGARPLTYAYLIRNNGNNLY